MDVAGAVLCGGSSRRMGVDKALIDVDGVPMAERVARVLDTAGCEPVVFVGGDEDALRPSGRRWIPDEWPGAGPVGGVLTALRALTDAVSVLVVACDLPDLTPRAVRRVVGFGQGGVDVPGRLRVADSGRLEPMVACWPTAAIEQVASAFAGGQRALHEVVAGFDALRVPVDPSAVRNVNRPDDMRNRSCESTG